MYLDYFGFREAPFSIAPDPQFLYMSRAHQEALAHLMYGVREAGGIVLLTGEVGTGKTTVCRCLLEQLPDQTRIAFILSPRLSSVELLATICDEFGIQVPGEGKRIKPYLDCLYHFLLRNHAEGRSAVVIIDEAQNLSVPVLEQLRLLTNLETNQNKLLKIVLLGQPQLRDLLGQPELEQLSQRITARYHLGALASNDVAAYVAHRLHVAGGDRGLIPQSAIKRLYALSGGVPRLINVLCDRALMGAFARERKQVSRTLLNQAAAEVFDAPSPGWTGVRRDLVIGLACLLAVFGGIAAAHLLSASQSVEKAPITPVANPGVPAPAAAESVADDDNLPWQQAVDDPGMRQAYREVFRLWGYDLTDEGAICPQARAQGGLCLHRKGTIGQLEQYNRPAVLQLVGPHGETLYGAVLAIDQTRVELAILGQRYGLSLQQLARRWHGQFTLLWRPPEGYRPDQALAQQPEVTRWASLQLGQVFDPADEKMRQGQLGARLKQFQADKGLVADGVLGPLTLVRLNEMGSADVPQLRR